MMQTGSSLLAGGLGCLLFAFVVQGQVPQPLVAVHDSELTRALESMPAVSPTPTGAGTTGKQWWRSDWHYFVMPESVKEALRSDGTAFTVVGDSNVTAGLVLANGKPKYPIVISLAAEAIRDDEIAPLTNYVAAGGFLLVGASAFTRYPDGSSRGDFAFANALGLHTATPGLLNWGDNFYFSKLGENRLLAHIPAGQLTWRMPAGAEEICWGVSPEHQTRAPHAIWQVAAEEATVIAAGDSYPYMAVRPYGKGCFIYCAALQPLVGHGGFAPTMYAYGIFRQAIEWAFESANLPVPRLSPWPYAYDAAFVIRHDLENVQEAIANLEASARVEYTNGAKGDYYFCTGTLREEMADAYDTNAVVASLRRAVRDYQATIGPHNGGLINPVNGYLRPSDYDYWHWGPDEALDETPAGYASGKAYALASLSDSFRDVESWLAGVTNGLRCWVSPYFNGTREDSYAIQSELGVHVAQDQKLTPFPHWTLSTRTPNKRYSFVSIPVSDWFVNGAVAQSLEPWRAPSAHNVQTLHEGIDFYYNLGGVINFYSHTLSTGQGDAGQLVPEYIAYSLDTNLHPRIWSANAASLYGWWLKRSQAQVSATATASGSRFVTTLSIAGATDPNTAVEWVLPPAGTFSDLAVFTNGIPSSYRLKGQVLKLRVGSGVTNAQVQYVVIDEPAFSDDFTRSSDPGPLLPWNVQAGDWTVAGGLLRGGPQTPQSYGYAYVSRTWANYAVQARIQFPAGAYGGGVGGCLNPLTGAHYAAWIYPGSGGGAGVLKLLKFQSWSSFGYADIRYVPMQEVAVPAVGTNWHTLKLAMEGAQLQVSLDGALVLSATDEEPEVYSGGGVSVEMWTDTPYRMLVDDVLVEPIGSSPNGPVLPVQADQQVWELTRLVVTNTAASSQPLLTYSLLAGPTNATISSGGVITWIPSEAQGPGITTFTTRVVDNLNPALSATNSFTATVAEVNQPPVLPVQGNRTVGLTTLVVTNTASDPDLPANALTYSLLSAPSNAVISANGVITWRPTAVQSGTFVFQTVVTDSNPLAVNAQSLRATNSFTVQVGSNSPSVVLDTTTLAMEGCLNHAIDPGETVTMLFSLKNIGQGNVTNLVVRLLETNGVVVPSGPLTYGLLVAGGPAVSQPFSFTATGVCGATITPTLQFQDGTLAAASFPLGQPGTILTQSFDLVAAPALPSGWTTSATGGQSNWVSVAGGGAEGNAAFSPDRATIGVNELVSPVVLLPLGAVQLSFRNNYDLESDTAGNGYDGGVLEIKLGTNAFVDILAAGGSFASGGYNSVIGSDYGNPLAGRQAWSGNSGGFISTLVNLPAAPGQTMQLRWRCGTDDGTGKAGWQIDSVTLTGPACCESSGPLLLPQIDRTIAELSPLLVTNTVLNRPANALNYRLLTAPAGAQIDAQGLISWTPNEAQGPGTNLFTTVVTDNGAPALSATNSFSVMVNEVNQAPVLPAQSNRFSPGLQKVVVTNTATDADLPANGLTYTLTIAPAGASIDTNGIIFWSPRPAQVPSTNLIETVVSDDNPWALTQARLSTTNRFTVVVDPVHNGPILPAQTNRTLLELSRLVITNTASDIDWPPRLLTYLLIAPPAGASIDSNGVISWTPGEEQGPTTNVLTTVVLDDGAPPLGATNRFTVLVQEWNQPPVLPTQADRRIVGLEQLMVTNTASDSDLPVNGLTYRLLEGPPRAGIDVNGVIAWTPVESQVPSTNLIVTVVTDANLAAVNEAHLSVTNSFTVYVDPVHLGPKLPRPGNFTIDECTSLAVTNTARDIDVPGRALSYMLMNPPAGASIDTNGIITWTPGELQGPSTNVLTTVVTDDGEPVLGDVNRFVVVVQEVNTAPTLPVQPDRTLLGLERLVVTNAGSDADLPGNSLTYQLIQGPTGAAIDTNGVITWTPAVGMVSSTNVFTTVASDFNPQAGSSQRLSATNRFTVVVKAIRNGPVLPVLAEVTLSELTPLRVTNTATVTDVPAFALAYTLVNAPAGASIDAEGIITWTPGESQGPSTNELTTVVTDAGQPPLSATNRLRVVVTEENGAPVLPVQPDRVLRGLEPLSVTNQAADADLPANGLAYELLNPPAGASIDTNGAITWMPAIVQVPSTNVITTVVTDDNPWAANSRHLSRTNRFTVVVSAIHDGPSLPAQATCTLNELTALVVTNSAIDKDIPATILSYVLVNPPAGAQIDGKGIITWTPAENQGPSTNMLTTLVMDDAVPMRSAVNAFTVIVNEVNSAPQLPVQADRTLAGFQRLLVTNAATDADLPANPLTYTLLTGPAGASIDADGVISWTPTADQLPSTDVITTVVTDSSPHAVNAQHLSATNLFTVVARVVHKGPVLPDQSDRLVTELATLVVTNTATDNDMPYRTVSYTLIDPPSGASIGTNGVITWTPTEAQGPSTNLFLTVASDDGEPVLSVTNRFTVVVKEVNTAPVLPTQINPTLAGLQTLLVTNTATDADLPGNRLTYRLVAGPADATIDANGLITWTPTAALGAGSYLFTTVVTDENPEAINASSLSATNSFTAVVTLAHRGPSFPALADRTTTEYAALVVTNTARDTDLPVLHLSYTLINPPKGASINAQGIVFWTPDEEQGPSTNTFTVVAMDDGVPVLSAVNHFVVVVNELNQPPVLPVQTNSALAELTTLVVTNTATDADVPANSLEYALLDAPAGATIDTNGVITWTPAEVQGPGTYTLTTVVTDSNPWAANAQHLSATNSFTVTVAEVNRPPELPFQPDRLLAGTQPLIVTNTALDPDLPANPLTYTLVTGPTNAVIDPNGVITWTPALDQVPSTNLLTTVVTDNAVSALRATNSFTVAVHFAHNGPVLPLQPEYIITELALLCITNSAIDTDVPVLTLSYSLRQAPAGMSIDTNGIITWIPDELQGSSTNIVETVVSDSGDPSLSATNRLAVVVQEGNSAPVLPAQTDFIIPEFSALVVTNSGTDSDIPANQLSYTLLNAPDGVNIDTNGIITWTPTEAQGPSTNLITTMVTDNGLPALSTFNSFTIVVTEVNSAPVLPLQPDRLLPGTQTLRVTNTAGDPDIPANVLTYALTVGPANASIDLNGVITWTPSSEQVPGTSRFEVVVTDNGVSALSATNSFLVFVAEPVISIQSVHLTDKAATITWAGLKGRRYQLQYTGSLDNPDWKDVSQDLTATGPTVIFTNAVGQVSQRFYRVLVYPKE